MITFRQIRRSLIISSVVGTLLTVTNQYEAVFGAQPIKILKAVITYITPFCVTLMASLMERKRMIIDGSANQTIPPEDLKGAPDDIASIEAPSTHRVHTTD
jgi:hypothetical protein